MRIVTLGLGLVVAVVLALYPSVQAAGSPPLFGAVEQGTPTFSKDIAPILYSRCVECHRPTMFAPMSLLTYEEARPWARSIRQRVATRTMPPWGADPAYGVFRNDPRLSDKEIATILAWVDAGAPEGNAIDLPAAPTFAEGWSIGDPDMVFVMPADFKIPASGVVEYQYLRLLTGITKDTWLEAIEIKPQARGHVHHAIAFTQPSGSPLNELGALGPGNIGGVTPNKPGVVLEPGVGFLLTANSDIILQMHYTTNGEAATDRTQVGVRFAKQAPRFQQSNGTVFNPWFLIPAGAPAHEVKATRVLTADTMITSFTPHMHVRGKDMTYIAKFPNGTTETLLSVPNYDFNWQITYELSRPRLFPKGTQIEVIAHYDNSTANKFNPDPAKDVRWGDQTWDEMMIGFWGTVVERPVPSSPLR